MTAREMVEKIQAIITRSPEAADWPVHILDMEEDNGDSEDGGIATHVEADCFHENVGMVISITSWPSRSAANAEPKRTGTPA